MIVLVMHSLEWQAFGCTIVACVLSSDGSVSSLLWIANVIKGDILDLVPNKMAFTTLSSNHMLFEAKTKLCMKLVIPFPGFLHVCRGSPCIFCLRAN